MTRKKKPPFESGKYFNLTGIGIIFGLKATEVAEKLAAYGLREDKTPTELAVRNGFVEEYTSPINPREMKYYWQKKYAGEKYWRWSTDRISLLLMADGLTALPNKYRLHLEKIVEEGRKTHLLNPVSITQQAVAQLADERISPND